MFPEKPTAKEPYFQDGFYGEEVNRVSPEGNVYGQRRKVKTWIHQFWWDGESYRTLDVAGRSLSVKELPMTQRPFGEVWQVRFYVESVNAYEWREYYWDSAEKEWIRINWLYDVDAISELPVPGLRAGSGHFVLERDVEVFWDGYTWRRPRHSSLDDDEPERHMPAGFLKWYKPDVKITFVNPSELVLEAVDGGGGQVWVNGEYIQAQKDTAVFCALPALEWAQSTNTIIPALLEPETEYWIYLANTLDPTFLIQNEYGSTWDFKGKLFLSRSADVNGYFSDVGAGQNARLVGKVQTDDTAATAGGPYFLRELNISLISRTVSYPDTFRDYSDYQIRFIDQDTLRFALLDGLHGMIYVGGNLEYIGADYEIKRSDPWVRWNESIDGNVVYDASALNDNETYYIYISAKVDEFNFNGINPDTNRPWMPTDKAAGNNYVAAKDLRLKPFLSKTSPDHGRLSEQWPGYYTRHIGQVTTDDNAKFIYSRDLSIIRQPQLNPTDFDGLAEIHISGINAGEFQVCRKAGTSGVVNVAGYSVQTFERLSNQAHKIFTSDSVYSYHEDQLNSPLETEAVLSSCPQQLLYLYLANHRDCWGELKEGLFVTASAPQNGYLSRNWPGNQARWIANLWLDNQGRFTGSFVRDSIASVAVTIDDFDSSLTKVWSSSKTNSLINELTFLVQASKAYASQLSNGIPLRLMYGSPTWLLLLPISGQDVTVVFPDLSYYVVPAAGLWFNITSQTPYTLYYVWFGNDGLITINTTGPDAQGPKLHTLENSVLLGYCGFVSSGGVGGYWGVYSFWNQQPQTYTRPLTVGYTILNYDGLIVAPSKQAGITATGRAITQSGASGYMGSITYSQSLVDVPVGHDERGTSNYECPYATWVVRSLSSYPSVAAGCYAAGGIWQRNEGGWTLDGCGNPWGIWAETSGNLVVNIPGS